MTLPRFVLMSLASLVGAASTVPADLSKIDRTINKEPAYESKTPRYCLLVFGPEAKTRIWLVLDGDLLYVDRNGNGDLTEEGERMRANGGRMSRLVTRDGPSGKEQVRWESRDYQIGELTEPGGKVTCKDVRLSMDQVGGGPPSWSVSLRRQGKHPQYGGTGFPFADRPGDAPILHFNGPLTMGLPSGQVLVRDGKDRELYALVGTPGLGKGTFTSFAHGAAPPGSHPIAAIEFPHRQPGREPIKQKITLSERC